MRCSSASSVRFANTWRRSPHEPFTNHVRRRRSDRPVRWRSCRLAPDVSAAQRVTIRTDDGVMLSGTWHEPSNRPGARGHSGHMFQRSRRDWDGVASQLAAAGIGALTFDLRGHGESVGAAGKDFAAMVQDVKAARRFLVTRTDVVQGRVGIAGASLGANLAVLAAADDQPS